MKPVLLSLLLMGGLFQICLAQPAHEKHRKKKGAAGLYKTAQLSLDEDKYDIKHLKFNISLTNISTAISGDVTTTAVTNVSGFDSYVFELDAQQTIDSVKINNQLRTVASAGALRTVSLPAALPAGTSFTAQVFYHGQPQSGSGFFQAGMNHVVASSSGTHIMYTLSDPYRANEWWPCKQSVLDKIDSVDMWITVDANLKAGSNGLLKNVTPMPGNKNRFEWKTRYAINYYLISATVAPYSDYSYYMHFSNSTDSMLVQNYIYDSVNYLTPTRKANLDLTGHIIDEFSQLFGRYPFWEEKYGHCMAEPLGGGMEHQTMSTMGFTDPLLIAHELGHQWWGDHVTYGRWNDIWLSEGMATYCEQLFLEAFSTPANVLFKRMSDFNSAAQASGSVYLHDDTLDDARIFNGNLTYAKGGAVAHMLRYMAPTDSLFFATLRQFQQQFAFGNAVTTDLQNIAEQLYGRDLDTFFQQWIYKEGYPTYSAKWYQNGNTVYFQLNQGTSKPSSQAFFTMPVEVRFTWPQGDTIVKVYHTHTGQIFSFDAPHAMTVMNIDPNLNILRKLSSIVNDPTLHVANTASSNEIWVLPNPTTDTWQVSRVPAKARLELYNVAGQRLWKGRGETSYTIPAAHLPGGIYLLWVSDGDTRKSYKLVRWGS